MGNHSTEVTPYVIQNIDNSRAVYMCARGLLNGVFNNLECTALKKRAIVKYELEG
jgi:hypothetical protein